MPDGVQMLTPVYRYWPNAEWDSIPHTLASPAPDGTTAFYQESLSQFRPGETLPFDDGVGRSLCQYLTSRVITRQLEITDGPYVQVMEDDGSVPTGWVMLRALVWTDEFDLLVPVDADASAGGTAVEDLVSS